MNIKKIFILFLIINIWTMIISFYHFEVNAITVTEIEDSAEEFIRKRK